MSTRPIVETLRDCRGGLPLDDLQTAFQSLVLAVDQTGKRGKVVFELEVKKLPNTDNGAMVITDRIKLTLPKHESNGTVLFASPEGNLTRNHPKQDSLPGITLAGGMEVTPRNVAANA